MTRNDFRGMVGLAATMGFAGMMLLGCPSSGVGDPCIPEDEYKENFPGFKLTEENIESRSFQCQSRICLVNHFQGRVSCPGGQETPVLCSGPTTGDCPSGQQCTESSVGSACGGAGDCPETGGWVCEAGFCRIYVCSAADLPERCYVPGTQIPINVEVCGQCSGLPPNFRDALNAVYCSCRCGLAEGEDPDAPENANFNFCDCPDGYTCAEIRKNVGLGDKQIAGKYCIKDNTEYKDENQCGTVTGHWASNCKGTPSG